MRAFFRSLFKIPMELAHSYHSVLSFKWLALGIVVGAMTGLGAVLFYVSIEWLQHLLLTTWAGFSLPVPAGENLFSGEAGTFRPWLLFVFLGVIGLFTGYLLRRFVPQTRHGGTDGTDTMIKAFHHQAGHITPSVPVMKVGTSILTIAAGGSAGREGPISLLGAGCGSWLAGKLRLSAKERRILLLAGAAGGLGAIFRAPLGGALTAVEVIYREDFEAEALLPSIISSVVSYSIFTLVFGSEPIFGIPRFEFSDIRELPVYAILGLVCAATGWFYVRTFRFIKFKVFWPLTDRFGFIPAVALGGLGMASIGYQFPELLGGGQGWLELAMLGKLSVTMMAGMIVGKTLATSVVLGSGMSGGMFAPALFVGGMVLHQGKIAEMKTGEGKTLVATLPVVLNALSGKGVHVVTVNDYLARRDAAWMGQLYTFMGLSVGVIVHGLSDAERQEAYGADVTYGTNNEFGFDYLRDNMKFYKHQLVQRPLNFAIVDEVDSILIDEARTPLIISGPGEKSTSLYGRVNAIIPKLTRDEHFTIDEKARTVVLTDEGVVHCEGILNVSNLFDPANITLQHHILQALRAHYLFTLDDHYIVKDGQVVIVDEFTGRLMPGRRFSDGLHQALEAKEGVKVEAENQTLASITFQNFFRMYKKLAGMTGTADTEAVEFQQIYGLEVVVAPPNKPMVRKDFPDVILKTQKEKFDAIVEEIRELHTKGQPVLVGTTSIEKSEYISELLKKKRVPHEVLNAKHHEKEAEIVAMAGQKGRVTIATNMAGRGTDIVLGEGVREQGGLHILGSERHESRRIDNQLRGRAGRQGAESTRRLTRISSSSAGVEGR